MRRLIVIDVSNFIFRAFFAIRPLTAPDGTPVNAVYGVLTMFHRLINDLKPTHVLCARDTKGPSFRTEFYPEYKANRSDPPDDLKPQFALIDTLLERLHLPTIAMPGFEADDIIGTLIQKHQHEFDEILIASGDKDLMQFVNERVKMLDTMKEKTYGPADVEEKMGVPPQQIVDYLALIGDSSDNIPGVPGIGPKGASALLKEFGTLEACLERADEVKAKKTQSALKEHAELARISKRLATIKCDLDLPIGPGDFAFQFHADVELANYLDRLGFRSFLSKIGPVEAPTQTQVAPAAVIAKNHDVKQVTVTTQQELQTFLKNSKDSVSLFAVFHDELDPFASLTALAIMHEEALALVNLSDEAAVWRELATVGKRIVAWDLKPIWLRFLRFGLELTEGEDLSQMCFVLSPEGRHDLDTLSREYTQEGLPSLAASGQGDLLQSSVDTGALAAHVRTVALAYQELKRKLIEQELDPPYRDLDLPLLKVLARMELHGISLDAKFFAELEKEFALQTAQIEKDVEKLAGHAVNLKSPKQVAVMLFEEQGLPVIKKTKTGYSTDADVLEELAALKTNPIPEMLLRYREVEKLNSTYVKVLPRLVAADGRLHTHFRPSNAATGRLSSDNPNLQNIPVRTENGRRLRRGFVAAPGKILLSADYSQVELRILAHFTEDPVMLDAFATDKDIHIQTAAEVFGVKLSEVTKEQRNSAKAINFGLMYGQGAFGLSQSLKISQSEARDYIKLYFQRFGRVKGYLDSLKEKAEATGYAETLFGRKRLIPEIKSQNRQVKSMAERVAINSPIQGTAADIIKLAMVHLQQDLLEKKLEAKLLLQVHDELILELPPHEEAIVSQTVRERMENAVKLRVPLKVDMGVGLNWYELK